MNEHFKPKQVFSYLFIIAIAVLFALQWGPGSRGCDTPLRRQTAEVAATVNGKDIPLREFNRTYAMQLGYMRQQGSPISESLARQLGIPSQVLDQLVNGELLAQAAEREGILPSDKEIRDVVHKNPDFQKDGKFDFQRYREVLRDYYRRTDVDYEADLRRRMAAQKLLDLIESTAAVSDDEVKTRFLKENNRASATFVRFLPAMYADKVTAPKSEEVASFAQAHEKEVSDYYASNKFLYQQPERVKARHILIKVAQDASPAAKNEAKQKLDNLRKEIEGGKDFAEIAKQNSEDIGSKENGGDLGYNERSAWAPAFAEAAFSLKVGELSQPVETQYGWHLIKVEDKKPPENKELKDVASEIAKQLVVKEKAKALAQAEAEKALAAAKSGKKLADLFPHTTKESETSMRLQTESKPEAIDTGEFTSTTESVPQLGVAPELVRDIFALDTPKPLDRLYAAGGGSAVVVVTLRKLPNETEFMAQKDDLRTSARKGKQVELRDAFLKSLKKGSTIFTNDQAIGKSSEG